MTIYSVTSLHPIYTQAATDQSIIGDGTPAIYYRSWVKVSNAGFSLSCYIKIPGLFQDTRSIFQDPRDKQQLLQYPDVGLLYGIEACKCAYFGVCISIVAEASASLPSKFQDFP